MGRGIDFKGVNLVVNYDFPPSAISYIHRIGKSESEKGCVVHWGRSLKIKTKVNLSVGGVRGGLLVCEQEGIINIMHTCALKQAELGERADQAMPSLSSQRETPSTWEGDRLTLCVTSIANANLTIHVRCLSSIANVMQSSGCEVPQWMLQLKKPSKYVTMATMNTSAGLVPLSQLELIGSVS